jgi:Na+/phosphate symporter
MSSGREIEVDTHNQVGKDGKPGKLATALTIVLALGVLVAVILIHASVVTAPLLDGHPSPEASSRGTRAFVLFIVFFIICAFALAACVLSTLHSASQDDRPWPEKLPAIGIWIFIWLAVWGLPILAIMLSYKDVVRMGEVYQPPPKP